MLPTSLQDAEFASAEQSLNMIRILEYMCPEYAPTPTVNLIRVMLQTNPFMYIFHNGWLKSHSGNDMNDWTFKEIDTFDCRQLLRCIAVLEVMQLTAMERTYTNATKTNMISNDRLMTMDQRFRENPSLLLTNSELKIYFRSESYHSLESLCDVSIYFCQCCHQYADDERKYLNPSGNGKGERCELCGENCTITTRESMEWFHPQTADTMLNIFCDECYHSKVINEREQWYNPLDVCTICRNKCCLVQLKPAFARWNMKTRQAMWRPDGKRARLHALHSVAANAMN